MSTVKKKGGRPPRAPGEKLQRINLTLRPSLLFGLEVVARDRRTSLSQAAEYLIEQQLRSYQVEGAPATGLLDAAAGVIRENLARGNPLVTKEPKDAEEVISLLLASPSGRAFFMPQSLQSPSERYFRAFYARLLSQARNALGESDDPSLLTPVMLLMSSLARPDLLEHLHASAQDAEQKGIPVDEAAASMYESILATAAMI